MKIDMVEVIIIAVRCALMLLLAVGFTLSIIYEIAIGG